jgi:hypothetical protein
MVHVISSPVRSYVWVLAVDLEAVVRDPLFENWLVNRVLDWLSSGGVRLPEYVTVELKLVSDGIRLRLLEAVEFEDGDFGVVGVLDEKNFSTREVMYLYKEYIEDRARRQTAL